MPRGPEPDNPSMDIPLSLAAARALGLAITFLICGMFPWVTLSLFERGAGCEGSDSQV
jgi:hypothetical protein